MFVNVYKYFSFVRFGERGIRVLLFKSLGIVLLFVCRNRFFCGLINDIGIFFCIFLLNFCVGIIIELLEL